ncbi:MAG: hypothetical protein WEB07_01350, partial [Natronospirillum sp.]
MQSLRTLTLIGLLSLAACSTAPVTEPASEPETIAESSELSDSVTDLPTDTDRPISELADEMPMSMLRSDLIRINRNPQTPEAYAIELAKIFQLRSQPDQSSRVLSTLRFNQLTPNEQRDY